MFQSTADYYTVLHLESPEVVAQFTGFSFLQAIQLSYPISANEQLVMNAFYETLNNLKQIEGVTTTRIANSLHYGYDTKAKKLDPGILEKHEIFFNDKSIGTGVACTTGIVIAPLSTLQ